MMRQEAALESGLMGQGDSSEETGADLVELSDDLRDLASCLTAS